MIRHCLKEYFYYKIILNKQKRDWDKILSVINSGTSDSQGYTLNPSNNEKSFVFPESFISFVVSAKWIRKSLVERNYSWKLSILRENNKDFLSFLYKTKVWSVPLWMVHLMYISCTWREHTIACKVLLKMSNCVLYTFCCTHSVENLMTKLVHIATCRSKLKKAVNFIISLIGIIS